MTTYTYAKPLDPSVALQKRIHQARQHAANIEAMIDLKRIEEANAEAEANLEAAKIRNRRTIDDIARRRKEAAKYPVHPEWMRHRQDAIRELAAWHRERRSTSASRTRVLVPSAVGNGLGGMVGQGDHTRPLASAFQGAVA